MPAMTPSGTISRWNAANTAWSTMFRQNLEAIPTVYDKYATVVPGEGRETDYIWMDRAPAMREWVGERLFNNPSIRIQSLVNKKYEFSLSLDRTDIEDDKLGVFDAIVPEIALAARRWPDVTVAAAAAAGTSTVVYDGQYFFDIDHPVNMDDSSITDPNGYSTQVNLFTGAASGNQPGALPLNGKNLQTARQVMASWVDPAGQPMYVQASHLMVPTNLEYVAREILHGQLIAQDLASTTGTTHSGVATSNVQVGSLELIVNPYMANDASWQLLCCTRATKPYVWQVRESPETIIATSPSDQNVFLHDAFQWGVRARGAAGYGQFFLAAKACAT